MAMSLCELCLNYTREGNCELELPAPQAMSCREFRPSMEGVRAERKGAVASRQTMQVAQYPDLQKVELRKVRVIK